MDQIDTVLAVIGFLVVAWWLFGFILLTFFAQVFVQPGAPLWPKIMTVMVSGFILPWLLFTTGSLPKTIISQNNDEADAMVRQWMADTCNCAGCRARREEEK